MMTVRRRWGYTFLSTSASQMETSALSSVLKKLEHNYAWQTVLLNYVTYLKLCQLFLLWAYSTNHGERRVSPEPYWWAVTPSQFHCVCVWLFLLDFFCLIKTMFSNLEFWIRDWRHSFDVSKLNLVSLFCLVIIWEFDPLRASQNVHSLTWFFIFWSISDH